VEDVGVDGIPHAMRQSIVQVACAEFQLLTLDTLGSVTGKRLPGNRLEYYGDGYGEADVPASATADVVEIEAALFTSAALKKDGSVVRWGKGTGTAPVQTRSGRIRSIHGGCNFFAIGVQGEALRWHDFLKDYTTEAVPESLRSGVVEINGIFALKEDGTVYSLFGSPVPSEFASGMAHLVESPTSVSSPVYNAAAGIKRDGRLHPHVGHATRHA
jgi:hypothetical protein